MAPKGAFCLVGVLFACFLGRSVFWDHHLSFTVSVFRSDEGACCSPHRNRTTSCFAYSHALFTTKSIWRALLSAFCGDSAQYCANKIHSVNNVGAQPLLMKNNASLKVSVSPIGFFQKTACISLGHSFKEKKAFPFRSFNNCLRRSDTCFFE